MCLYTKYIENPKYRANKKNGGVIPAVPDYRVRWVPIACGDCMECRKKKSREWLMRLTEEVKHNNKAKFITLTFNPESLSELRTALWEQDKKLGKEQERQGYDLDNGICTIAIRRFYERWRKEHKKPPRYWFINELGHGQTEHVHMHGIIWDTDVDKIERIWKYGFIWKGKPIRKGKVIIGYENYVSEATVSYMMKYVTKVDFKHKHFKPLILCSNGIGRDYMKTMAAEQNKFNGDKTREYYLTKTGHKVSLPIYIRNKVYNEKERELLWIKKLDEEVRYVCGEKVSVKDNDEAYKQIRDYYRKKNAQLGYGSGFVDGEALQNEINRRRIMQETKMAKAKKNASGGSSGGGFFQDIVGWW